jgi:hypothetical protein
MVDTASVILDKAQKYLHDTGTIWSREELLGYLNHGYMRLLAESDGLRRLAAYETPARSLVSITHPWERQYAHDFYRDAWTMRSMHSEVGEVRCTYAWEVQHNDGGTVSSSENNSTQSWERTYCGRLETNDRYTYPDDILSTFRIWYNGIRIHPTSVKELDNYTANWNRTTGRPFWYSPGLGRQRQFEIWPDTDTYTQSVDMQNHGTPRSMSGSLSYTFPTGGYGTVRGLRGTRQYICEDSVEPGDPPLGIPMSWTGSDNAILLDYSMHAPTLEEEDSPELLPQAFSKYLRYYVIARAYGRVGEGHNPDLAAHYEMKWQMGVKLLERISKLHSTVRTYQNQPMELRQFRPMRPRLPAEYPRIR